MKGQTLPQELTSAPGRACRSNRHSPCSRLRPLQIIQLDVQRRRRSDLDMQAPTALLFYTAKQPNETVSQVLHIYPQSAAATTSQNVAALLLAMCGITTKLTGDTVSQVSFGSGAQGLHAAFVHAQPFGSSHALDAGHHASDTGATPASGCSQQVHTLYCEFCPLLTTLQQQTLLQHVVKPQQGDGLTFTSNINLGLMDKSSAVEYLDMLQRAALAMQPVGFVGTPQACLINRSLLMHSHMGPAPTHAIWALCWGLGLHARTPSHPPLIMLQDLYVPSHRGIDKATHVALDGDRIRLAAVLVGLGDSLLCLGLWPGAAQNAACLTGSAIIDATVMCLQDICSKHFDQQGPAETSVAAKPQQEGLLYNTEFDQATGSLQCCEACVGKLGDDWDQKAAQHVNALRMHRCLRVMPGQNSTEHGCTSSKQDSTSGSGMSSKLKVAMTGATVTQLSVHNLGSKMKQYNGKSSSVQTSIKGFMQEDTLFACSVSRS